MPTVTTAAEVFALIRRAPKGLYSQAVSLDPTRNQTSSLEEESDTYDQDAESETTLAASPTASEVSIHNMTSDHEEDDSDSSVLESAVALFPACCRTHGTFKGKGREGERRLCQLHAMNCGRYEVCKKAVIVPSTGAKPQFRLLTGDALHDLKRWLTTPNSRLGGAGDETRSPAFLQNDTFTETNLRDAIVFAINTIQYEHAHIDSLVSYARRAPYNINIRLPAASNANMNYFSMEAEHFDGVPRDGLEEDLVNAAVEIDYLRGVADAVGEKILAAKVRAAKFGDKSEMTELVRLEVVDETWVQRNCWRN